MTSISAQASEKFIPGTIHDVVLRLLKRHVDGRGWLAEIFRADELPEEFRPVMSYLSWTEPGVVRGPHEHLHQADFFCFAGPSRFKLRMWDTRPQSPTYGLVMTLLAGDDSPLVVLVPAGVVHAYQNVGDVQGLVINCPNRLYAGEGRREPVDEIRHEDDPRTIFSMDDE